MPVAVESSGTQTAVLTTEHTLVSVTHNGRFSLEVDCSAMAAGDVVELRAYKILLASGTKQLVQYDQFSGAVPVSEPVIKEFDELNNTLSDTNAIQYTLKQLFGTGRAYPWSVGNSQSLPTQGIKKNTARKFYFTMYDSTTGAPKTGLTVTATRALDGATSYSSVGGSVAEVANGEYCFSAAAADLNADDFDFRFAATGASDTHISGNTVQTS